MERWVLYALLSMVFAGATSVLAKYGMKGLNSDAALMVRTFIVFILVAVNALCFKNAYHQIKATSAANLLMLAVSGIATTLSWIFYYRAMKEGPVSYVAAIDKASIVITLILSFTLLREPMTPKILLGGGFILTGMLILVWK
jgi:transporter family protein